MAEENEVQADSVFVLLKKNYRISRNIRLIWFFNNILRDLNKLPRVVSKDGKIDDFTGHEIQVLSWSQKVDGKLETTSQLDEPSENSPDEIVQKCTLQPETSVYFLSRGYRLVFALDLSPSAFRIDVESFGTIAEGILSRLADCLFCLVKPFQMPNSDVELQPNIYVTVFSQTRPTHKSMGKYTQDVIVQGCLLTPKSVSSILNAVECKIHHGMKTWPRFNNIDSSPSLKHDHGLVSMLRTGLLALQLLPSNTSAGIVVITDGVVGVPDMAVLETLLNQLRSTTTSCSFLHVKSSQTVFHDYAYCINIELLKFMSEATYGTFFESSDDKNFQIDGLNIFQKCLLMWRFQIGDETDKLSLDDFKKSDIRSWEPETDLRYTPKQKNMYISPILRKKHFEHTLRVSIFALISVRLREGYMIDTMTLGKDQNQLEVKLIYPWNHGVSIKYSASSPWPVTKSSTKVEVFVEGTYEFLFDIFAGVRQENWSRYRSIVARRFKHFLKGLTQTDHMMTHLQSFNSDPVNYIISDTSLLKHIPLFYLPPNSNQLVLSMPDAWKPQFALYWKPVLSLDINIWQKWLHTHHIDIILQHDLPLPKHLHVPSKSGRYHTIQTSSGMSRLTSLLRDWCTFVLLENHSYVKFTYKENEEKPSSFYVVRLSSKAPVVVIRLAFLIGTPGPYRNQILTELRDRVLALTFPSTNKLASTMSLRPTGTRSRNPSAQARSRHVSASERSCAVLIHKPLDRILIRYDQTPKDFLQPPTAGYRHGKSSAASSRSGQTIVSGGEVGSTSMMQDLCRYMEHDRCVWSITNRSKTPLSVSVVGQIANLLVKLRLSEGFNFASTSSGVTCMTREFPMTSIDENGNETTSYCLAQFIIFPPTVCTSRESFSLDGSEDEEDTAEADGELLLATEMWIEPQCGRVVSNTEDNGTMSFGSRHPSGVTESSGQMSRLSSVSSTVTTFASNSSHQKRFAEATYRNLPQIIFDEDHFFLTILVTIEHLRLMCVPRNCVLSTFPQQSDIKKEKNDGSPRSRKASSQSYLEGRNSLYGDDEISSNLQSAEGITHYPCLFDLVSLLDHCPRIKLLFMTLSQDVSDRLPHPNKCLFDFFHGSLSGIFDREADLSENDSVNITKHMIKRNDSQHSSEDVHFDLKWKCYLKVLPKAKVLVVLLPSTFEDLQKFANIVPELIESESNVASSKQETNGAEVQDESGAVSLSRNVSQESDGKPAEVDFNSMTENSFMASDHHRVSRRRSIKRFMSLNLKSAEKSEPLEKDLFEGQIAEDSLPERQPQISLPVFMYECTTSKLVENLLNDPTLSAQNISNSDIEHDYRMKSVDSKVEPESTKHRYFRSQSYPTHHISGVRNEGFFSPPLEDVFDPSTLLPTQWTLDSESSALCETVVDAYHRCFVRAVANNLRLADGHDVASVDVQAADDLCIESMKEIDITQFLLITCPQVAAFKNQHIFQAADRHDDVFMTDVTEHLPVPPVKSMIRHTSSTSSTTDPCITNTNSQISNSNKKASSESPDQGTRGSKNQVTGLNREEIAAETPEDKFLNKHNADINTEKPVKSAFKKLRKRPQSLPKTATITSEKEVSDLDTPESETPAFLMQASEELLSTDETNVGSLPKSIKVSKPLQKLPVGARVDWDCLPEFPVALLQESHLRHISGNDDHIRMNFNELLSNNFSIVHTMPDIFYYDPKVENASNPEHDDDEPEAQKREKATNEIVDEVVTESDLDVKFELGGNDTMTEIELQPQSNAMGMLSSDGFIGKYERSSDRTKRTKKRPKNFDGFDLNTDFGNGSDCSSPASIDSLFDNELYGEQQDVPLFLCMTCTIWDKNTGNHGTTVVEGLPTSLLTVISSLERPCDRIDLSQLRITLDLIWITLPLESKEELTPDIEYQDIFMSGLLPDEDDSPRHDPNSTRRKINTLHEDTDLPDPLSMLSVTCAEAVISTKEEIEWLLKDEIISALRTCEIVDSTTLQKVTSHIEESQKSTCVVETSKLQFVFGAEKSLQLFHSEFEKMFKDFEGYRMKKEGEYYYFTKERTFFPITNWTDETAVFQAIDQASDNAVLYNVNNSSVKPQYGRSHAGSNSSGGKVVQDTSETYTEKSEHMTLRRTKTAPNALRSPPARICVTSKSGTSLSFTSSVHSNTSFRSLPTTEAMSIDAIESDVSNQVSMNQFSAMRKTSAFGSVSPSFSSSKTESASRVKAKGAKVSKHGKSRLSLPNTGNLYQDSSDGLLASGGKTKKRIPVKQHSVDSEINSAMKQSQKRHSTHGVTPLSLRNSPQSNSGPRSPLVTGQSSCHNSSFGSASSAPTGRHRSSQNNTPVAQVLQRYSADPSSSTSFDDWDTDVTVGIHYKEAMSSPVSISDGEYRNSTASGLGSGYDAEGESDVDDFDRITSIRDSSNDLPSFWLIVHVSSENVKTYFHRRSSAVVNEGVDAEHKRIFSTVIDHVMATCKRVNQILLLNETHDSRMCNALLVEETEDDIWRHEYSLNSGQPEDTGDNTDGLLAAAMTTAPGQFACDCVMEKVISLHPRLRMGGSTGKSSVIPTVQDLVINFMITNRKNMFVYRLLDKSVFYCRIEEDFGQHSVKGDSRRSSQLLNTAVENTDFSDRRTSRESLSGVGLIEQKSNDKLTLRWHGVGPLLPQQEDELEKMNQSIIRRLDDSILEKIAVILQRKSKLTSADVQFIQPSSELPPSCGSPSVTRTRCVVPGITLSYGIPNEFIGCISAVNYYLHQNLLQYMAVPRYVDTTQTAAQFVAYKMGFPHDSSLRPSQATGGNDGAVFLFHQSIERGKTGYGIACVVLEITDVDGNSVSTDSTSKFDVPKQFNLEELLKLTEVIDSQKVMTRVGSRSNTPALTEQQLQAIPTKDTTYVKTCVRFHLWSKGSLTVDHLNKQLRPAVRHSLFDAITEMVILRSPLCDLNVHLKPGEDHHTPIEFHEPKQTASGKTDAMRSIHGSLNDPSSSSGSRGILTSLLHPKLEFNSKEEISPKQSTGSKKGNSPYMINRRKSASAQAEEGEIGSLRDIYKDLSKTWIDAMVKNDCPSSFKFAIDLSTMSHINNLLHDMQKLMSSITTECKVKLFISTPGSDKMLAFNLEHAEKRKPDLPGRYPSYILVARNFLLWRKSGQHSKTAKFQPYDSTMKPEQSPRLQEHRLISPNSVYIPRQQFVIVSIHSRSVNVRGYNLSSETARNLQVTLTHCVDFHNARRRALDCITMQKLSLFRHCMFETGFKSNSDDKKNGGQANSFTQDVKDVDLVLINSKLPSSANKMQSKRRSKSNKKSFFNDAYLSNVPVHPLSVCVHNKEEDVATKYANQYLEMKNNLRKKNEELTVLHRVSNYWRERPAATPNLTKEVLQVLLQNSRIIYHVTSPILFNRQWRRQVLKLKTSDTSNENDTTEVVKETQLTNQQKRLSGALRKSGDFSGKTYEDTRSRSRSNSTRKQSAKGSKGDLVQLASESSEETRYEREELQRALMTHYVQYWQTMHFILVKEERTIKPEKSVKKTAVEKDIGKEKIQKTSVKIKDEKEELSRSLYLYRVSTGGIVIVDISCVEMNFLIKLHVIEASRLQHQQNINQQMSVLFLNECEHLKDYTHVHSFAFDFHLRYLQMYIQDRQTAIRPGYHIVSLLQDFIAYYENPPTCAFNQIYQGTMVASCSHVLAEELYEYIVGRQSSLHGFKTLKLVDGQSPKTQHALVSSHLKCGRIHSLSCNKEEHAMYDVGYVIWHDPSSQKEEKQIKLNFFVLFTNRRHLFPRFDRPENPSSSVLPIRRGSSISTPRSTASPAPQKSAIIFKHQGLSPTSQSASNLHRLTDQPPNANAEKNKTKHLSPLTTRKAILTSVRNSSKNEEAIMTQPLSPEHVFSPPPPSSIAKRMLQSQGRRQSMPNVGRNMSASSRKELRMQGSLGHDAAQVLTESHEQYEKGSPLFVQCEIGRLKNFLTNVCDSAEIQCYRNQLWDKVYADKPSQNKTSVLPVEDFEHLLKHCQKVPLEKLNQRGNVLCNVDTMSIQWAISLQKRMMARFDQIYRFFTNADLTKRYLGILNPKLYYMMFLITVDTTEENIGMYVVLRDKQAELEKKEPDLENTTENPNLIPLCGHLNNMIDFICYHTWTSLLTT